jgi:hypothetical protein
VPPAAMHMEVLDDDCRGGGHGTSIVEAW